MLRMILALLAAAALAQQPDFVMQVGLPESVLPEAKSFFDVAMANRGSGGTNVSLRVVFSPGTKVLAIDTSKAPFFTCNAFAQRVVICRGESFAPPDWRPPRVRIRFQAPPLYDGGMLAARATMASAEPDLAPGDNTVSASAAIDPFFGVTTTADDGPGSLRQAILDANALCTSRCTVGFRIPGSLPDAGLFTVQPKSPLPAIDFRGTIHGAAQASWLDIEGSTPRVRLDGSRLASGDGLTLRTSAGVNGLAIANFPGAGIRIDPVPGSRPIDTWTMIEYVDLISNEHGLVDEANADSRLFVRNSVIRRNRRSGIVVMSRAVDIVNNGIEGNGASGIYLPGDDEGHSRIERNVIVNHPHAGIALQPTRPRSVLITENSIHDNTGGAIDYGLDGLTPNGNDAERFPNHPTVEARYREDWRGTTIDVHLHDVRARTPFFWGKPLKFFESKAEVELYASRDPNRQLERFLGRVEFYDLLSDRPISLRNGDFTNEDLRGWWITAVTIRRHVECPYSELCRFAEETSEPGPAVRVE